MTTAAAHDDHGRGGDNDHGGTCRLYVAAAGGGIWRTDKPLHTNPSQKWEYVSGSFGTNAIGALIIDPTDPSGNTLYAGTGEPNVSADSEAGVGIYKTTNGGDTWTHLASTVTALTTPGNGTYTGDAFAGRSIGSIVVDPRNRNVIYVASARGVRGVASTGGGDIEPADPEAAVRPLQVDRRRRDVHASSGTATPRFAASSTPRSTRATRTSSTRRRSTREPGDRWTAARPSPMIKASLERQRSGSPGVCGDEAAQRQDPDVPGRGRRRHAAGAVLPHRRRRGARLRSSPI